MVFKNDLFIINTLMYSFERSGCPISFQDFRGAVQYIGIIVDALC